MEAVTNIDIQGVLPLIARGKVRDLYEVDNKTLLFVATDRISAYDVIMKNVRPLLNCQLFPPLPANFIYREFQTKVSSLLSALEHGSMS